jgi:cardiolipin synthase
MNNTKIITIPNLISFFRFILVIVNVILILKHYFIVAFFVMIIAAASDYIDGYLARKLNQYSKLGALIDPLADRTLILSTYLFCGIVKLIPLWIFFVIVIREIFLAIRFLKVKKQIGKFLDVNFAGKFGSFALMFSAPIFLLTAVNNQIFYTIFYSIAWATILWGLFMYYIAGALYYFESKNIINS